MRIVLIGAGAVAESLLVAMSEAGVVPVALYNRTIARARQLKERYAPSMCVTDKLTALPKDADVYLFALSDAALSEVASQMSVTTGVWLHTAAALPCDVFAPYHDAYGLFYPFNTFTRNFPIQLSNTPLFVEHNGEKARETIYELAQLLGMNPRKSDVASRTKLHLAAVFACNFTNHLLAVAEELLADEENLSYSDLHPLIAETFRKANMLSPREAQSGPARRHDEATIAKHRELLSNLPGSFTDIYNLLTASIEAHYTK